MMIYKRVNLKGAVLQNELINLLTVILGKFSTDTIFQGLERKVVDRNTNAILLIIIALVSSICRVINYTSKINSLDLSSDLVLRCRETAKKRYRVNDAMSVVKLNAKLYRRLTRGNNYQDIFFTNWLRSISHMVSN